MLATILAALGQEFKETTADNVELGKQSISLIFNDKNKDMRLVGVLNPLRASDIPQDAFEAAALAYAMTVRTLPMFNEWTTNGTIGAPWP